VPTIADFIYVDNKGIVITTNNVVLGLDLQEIEKYVKNSLSSDTDKVSSVRKLIVVLLQMKLKMFSRIITFSTILYSPQNLTLSRCLPS